MKIHSPVITATPGPVAELDRLGDEIAELSAHLEAATARLLDLIREFNARGGWNTNVLGVRVAGDLARSPCLPCRLPVLVSS
jgi:hypothetical protein